MDYSGLRRLIEARVEAKNLVLKAALDSQKPLIRVDVDQQILSLLGPDSRQSYVISTALKGTGCSQDSFQTPTGLHQIADKIGENAPLGMVFKGRVATGEIASDFNQTETDQISSRILRLQGCEPGFNLGEGCDSYDRFIYIHGTTDEQRLGQPVSHGCVRMANSDVIELFDQVETGDFVLITSSNPEESKSSDQSVSA